MRWYRKHIVRLVIMCAAFGSMGWYLLSSKYGLCEYYELQAHKQQEQEKIAVLRRDIAQLHDTCTLWDTDPFEFERCARDELCMGYEHEYLYLVQDALEKVS